MAGVWEGVKGSDQHPVADGTEQNTFIEHYELHPIDAQTNGPQLFYGLRYHTHITKPGGVRRPFTTRWAIGSGNRRPSR